MNDKDFNLRIFQSIRELILSGFNPTDVEKKNIIDIYDKLVVDLAGDCINLGTYGFHSYYLPLDIYVKLVKHYEEKKKIACINTFRNATGFGLKDSIDIINEMFAWENKSNPVNRTPQ